MELLKKVEKYPGVKTLSTIPRTDSPVLPITFPKGAERFSYFSFITTVGTAQSITAQELRIDACFLWSQIVNDNIGSPLTISDRPKPRKSASNVTSMLRN